MVSKIINKKTVVTSLFFIFLSAILCGCAAYRYVTPYQTYNHELHEDPLLAKSMDCFSCHTVDTNETDPLKKFQKLKEMLKESNDKRFDTKVCHQCHIDEGTKQIEASSRCGQCHQSLNEILPLDHKGMWKNTHGVQAQVSDKQCMKCHNEWYCTNCHTARDMTSAKAHPRLFRAAHVSAAVADPASCGTCHNSSFCRDCHMR